MKLDTKLLNNISLLSVCLTMSCLNNCEEPGLFNSSVALASNPLGKSELSAGAFTIIALNLGVFAR